jgi:hypothetical protein
MTKRFGNESNGFTINCEKLRESSAEIFAKIFIEICQEIIGDFNANCHAGAIIHSANIFLKHKGNRQLPNFNERELFEYLNLNIYGANWRFGLSNDFSARFCVHEIFDVSVGDGGWLIFLIDKEKESIVLTGTRDKGFNSSMIVPVNYLEQTIQELIGWLSRPD